jgi:hypothetical protein
MAKKRKTVAKSAAVERNLEAAMVKLAAACKDGDSAVTVRSKTNKKLTAEVKRLTKKRGVLTRRKKTASARVKKSPSGETRRALRAVVRELETVKKAQAKAKAAKAANREELIALKAAQKRANAYKRVIAQADKALNKRKK